MEAIVIQSQKTKNIKPCECGCYPIFVQPSYYYTDIWLECPNCGKSTANTGGYHYAEEIKLENAKRSAIIKWNNGEYFNESICNR